MAKFKGTAYERFLTHINIRDNECWEWKGDLDTKGYGNFCYYKDNKRTRVRAHRASWEFAHGKIENNYFVCHKCDNRRCVNPEHLFLGTQKDNIADCLNKKRFIIGEKCKSSKLKESQVKDIFKFKMEGKTAKELVSIFLVSQTQIYRILNKKRWGTTTSGWTY